MSKVAILLTDEFGDEVLVTPIKELPMRVVSKLSDLDSKPFNEQYEMVMSVLTEASDAEVAQKVSDLTSEEFGKFLERWFVA